MCRGCFVSRTWSASCCSAIVALSRGLEALALNAFAFDSLWCESEHCTGSHGCRSLKNTVHWSKTSFVRSSMILHGPNSSLSFWSQKVENASQATLWHQWPFIVSKSVLWSQVSVRGYCFAHRVRIWSQFWRRSHSGWVRLTEKWSTIKNMVFSLYLEIPMRYAAFDIRFGIYAKFRVI